MQTGGGVKLHWIQGLNRIFVNRLGILLLLLALVFLGGLTGPLAPTQAIARVQATIPTQAQTPTAVLKDYTRTTEDKKFLLVMLSPDGAGQPDPALRQKYAQSGLYPNDGSTTPVWTTDWAAWYQNLPDSQLYTTPDGKYLARLDRATGLALAFYVIGIEVKRYGLYELAPTLVNQANPASGAVWVQKASLDPAQRRFVVETTTDERLEFDTTTGQRLPGIGKPDSVALVVAIIAIVVFTIPVGIIAYIGVKRQLKLNRIKKASG